MRLTKRLIDAVLRHYNQNKTDEPVTILREHRAQIVDWLWSILYSKKDRTLAEQLPASWLPELGYLYIQQGESEFASRSSSFAHPAPRFPADFQDRLRKVFRNGYIPEASLRDVAGLPEKPKLLPYDTTVAALTAMSSPQEAIVSFPELKESFEVILRIKL